MLKELGTGAGRAGRLTFMDGLRNPSPLSQGSKSRSGLDAEGLPSPPWENSHLLFPLPITPSLPVSSPQLAVAGFFSLFRSWCVHSERLCSQTGSNSHEPTTPLPFAIVTTRRLSLKYLQFWIFPSQMFYICR